MDNSKPAKIEELQGNKRLVSIVIPCLNEEKLVAKCLDSLVESDYPKNSLEVWVVDGLSEDRSREIVAEYGRRFPFIHLIDNPRRSQQTALNLGIRQARGEVIIRMDAHCAFSQDYIGECVRHLEEWGADNVGGRLITMSREDTTIGHAIAIAMSEPFGIGNSVFRLRRKPRDIEPRWVESVPYACYRRDVFGRIGLFNDQLDRSEDAELHLRMRRAGCKTLFVPSIVSYYYSRSTLKSFCMHVYDNGRWALLPTVHTGQLVVSLRHLIPLAFVCSLLGLGGLALAVPESGIALAVVVSTYLFLSAAVSSSIAWSARDAKYLVVMPLVFGLLHIGYGLGSLEVVGQLIVRTLLRGGAQPKASRDTVPETGDVEKLSSQAGNLATQGQEDAGTCRDVPGVQGWTQGEVPFVSVIIPCRNEEDFIAKCLDSIIENCYPKDRLEVIVVDGLSEDRTREVLQEYVSRYPYIEKLDNPRRELQLALDIGIEASKGQIVMRVDAHSTYKSNYISECMRGLQKYSADNVGGRWVTVARTDCLVAQAICHATTNVFGVGNAYYRLRRFFSDAPLVSEPSWDIHVAYFCCRKEVFATVGLFNEHINRSEDIDFRARLKAAGFRTLFMPTVESYYSMRTNYVDLVKHTFRNGLWLLLPLRHEPRISFSIRHVVPLLFVFALTGTGLLAVGSPAWAMLLWILAGTYAVIGLVCSVAIALRERDPRFVLLLPGIFLSLHVSYGLGSLLAAITIIPTLTLRLMNKLRHGAETWIGRVTRS